MYERDRGSEELCLGDPWEKGWRHQRASHAEAAVGLTGAVGAAQTEEAPLTGWTSAWKW